MLNKPLFDKEGVKLADTCLKALDGMRQRVETVTKTKDGRLAIKGIKGGAAANDATEEERDD